MAYVDNQLLEEDDQAQAGAGGPMVPGGGASVSAGQTPAAPAASKQKTPGNFADLSEYLRVNQPQEFGSKVAGKIGEDIGKAEQSLGTAKTQFKERADAATIQDTGGVIDQVGTSPETVDKTAFTGLRDAEYKGPNSFSDTQDLYNQASGAAGAAVGKANASKTEGGRFALLDNYFSRPNYSSGQKSLDNLLIQNDDNSKQAFAQMQQNAGALQQNVGATADELGNYGAQAKGKTVATRQAARGALGIDDAGNIIDGAGALGGLTRDVNSQYDTRVANQDADDAAIRDAFATNDFSRLTPAQRQIVGMPESSNSFDSYYRVDPTQYLSKPQLTQQNTATEEQQRRYAALTNLADMENTLLPDGQDTGEYANAPGVGYNFDALTNSLNAGKASYESELNTPSAAINETLPGIGPNVPPAEWGFMINNFPELAQRTEDLRLHQLSKPQIVAHLRDVIQKAQSKGYNSIIPVYQKELDDQLGAINQLNASWGLGSGAQTPARGSNANIGRSPDAEEVVRR